jgi:hypothetical protein
MGSAKTQFSVPRNLVFNFGTWGHFHGPTQPKAEEAESWELENCILTPWFQPDVPSVGNAPPESARR